ncbi:MAG: GAF domain-containing protein, partial [Chloroflexi bacterium]
MPSSNNSPKTEAQNQRHIITTIVDQTLHFIRDYPILRRWLDMSTDTLASLSVTAVFPELTGSEATIHQLADNPGAVCSFTQLQRLTTLGNRHFDLQIEPARDHPIAAYQVTLILRDQETIESDLYANDAGHGRSEMVKLAQHNRTLNLLNRASRILTETLDVTEVLERLLQVATQIIGAAAASVWLWENETSDWLICQAAFHPGSADRLVNQRVQRGQGIAGWVAKTGESAVVGNTNLDQRFTPKIDAQSGFTTDSLIAVPLQTRGKIIGVLEVVNKLEGMFENDDLTVVETLAASASIAIENASLVETMRQQMTDLQARNEELDAFDHTVAHNLQNPVALILGFGDILHLADDLQADQQQKALASIVANARKMSNIINDLLLLSSVRKSEMDTEPLDTAALVDAAMQRLEQKIKETRAEIIVPTSWPVALGHPGWIEEVWENYI